MSVERILIIGPSNIGDGILVSDVVARTSAAFPKAHLTLLVGERAKLLYEDDARIHTLVDLDALEGAWAKIRLTAQLIGYQPSLVIDLRDTAYPFLLKPWRAWRYVLKPPRHIRHMHERHLWKLAKQAPAVVAQPVHKRVSSLGFTPRDRQQVEQICRRLGVTPEKRFAMLCPGARSHIKRWVAEGFAAVADKLAQEFGFEIILSGEPEEEPIIDDVRRHMQTQAHSTVGLTTIRQLGLLMRQMKLVVTNDSASLHLACAVDAPTVAVFGPTDAYKYGPWGTCTATVRRRLFCSPCEKAQCRFSHECMRLIAPEQVMQAAREVLSARPRAVAR